MTDQVLGAALALISAISFACSNVFISMSAVKKSDNRGVLLSVVFTFGISTLAWLAFERGETGDSSGETWLIGIGWFALAGISAVVLGRTFLFASIRRLGVARAAATKRLNPFFSVLLAVLILSEPVTWLDGGGMILVALAFAILIQRSFAARTAAETNEPQPIDYTWGVASAFAYATAYILRKYGLAAIAAPAFGTMVSAAAGLAFFAGASVLVEARRQDFTTLFSGVDRWMVAAGFAISFGQISLFAALYYESVSTVVMINSLEIFISIFLSVVVFRTEAKPSAHTFAAAALATLGVIAVAAG